MIRTFFYFLLFVVLSNQVSAQDFKSLEQTVQQEIQKKSIAGSAIGVIKGESLVFSEGFGFANYKTKIPVATGMLFRLGSTTKMFVATAALMLVDQGKLDLQVPIRTYVTRLPPKLSNITMHQLLSHTAGLFDDAPMFGPSDEAALGKEIRSWKDDKIFLEPGQFMSYSNPGYWLAGYVIETIAKKPFADAMRQLVFEPIGMKNSTFRPEEAIKQPLALGHDKSYDVIDPPANNAATLPAGSMFSNIADISRFVIAIMNDGKIHGKRVLPQRVVEMLFTPRVKVLERPTGWYGYGLMFEVRRGAQYVFHTGSRNGYGSIIRMVPDKKFAVIAIANRSAAIMGETADHATEMFVTLKDSAQDKKFTYITNDADRYEGTFICPPTIELEFFKRGVLHYKKGYERIPVRKYSDTEYSNSYLPFSITFGKDGKAQYIHMEAHTMKRVK